MMDTAQVLTIAGSDSGGGAGIQADLKTFQMRGVYSMSVLTAVTAQNTLGVDDVFMLPENIVHSQIRAVAADFRPAACKIGMIGSAAMAAAVAQAVREAALPNIVLDPVMVAKGGAPLLQSDAVAALVRLLLPLACVLTPNLPETEALTGITVRNDADAFQAARMLQDMGAQNIVIKGGHAEGQICRDRLLLADGQRFTLESSRADTARTHGTGCTFSACIAAELAKGAGCETAVRTAKACIQAAIEKGITVGHGHGPVNHWAMREIGAP